MPTAPASRPRPRTPRPRRGRPSPRAKRRLKSSAAPLVSVVVVTWNSGAHLGRCLEALAAQTHRDFEVVLVDNASTDGSLDGLKGAFPRLPIRVQRSTTNVGFAAAANRGVRLASGKWIALLNPDAFPQPEWLESLVSATRSYPGAFLASRQIQAERPVLLDGEGDIYYTSGLALRQNYNVRHFPPGAPREAFSACAAAAFYPRADFLAAGGFDEDYFAYHEDVDLGFRLRLRGMRCFIVPVAIVHHVGAASSGPRSAFATYHGHRNLVWTFAKNMPSPWIWLYLPLHIVINLISIVYFVLAGNASAILRAKVDALRGLHRALGKRPAAQAQRRIPGRSVIHAMNPNPFGPLEGWISRQWPDVD